MKPNRCDRLNSLLKEVISDVISQRVRNPYISPLTTVSGVSITKDLHYAKVYISVLGTEEERKQTIEQLQHSSGFIATNASQQVKMRYFPELTFILDKGVDNQMKIEEKLKEIHDEEKRRDAL